MSVEAIEAALRSSDLDRAEALSSALLPGTGAREAAAVYETAYALEVAALPGRAAALYTRVFEDPSTDDLTRICAALRSGVTLGGAGRTGDALPMLAIAAQSTDRAIRDSAVLARLHLLVQAAQWERILADTDRMQADGCLGEVVQLHRVLARVHLATAGDDEPIPQRLHPSAAVLAMHVGFTAENAGYSVLALRLFELILATSELPEGVRTHAHCRAGVVLDRLYRWEEAEHHFRAAVDGSDPHPLARAEALRRLGNLHYLTDNFEGALPLFNALRNEPAASGAQRAEAMLRYGTSLLRLGRFTEAAAALQHCREEAYGAGTDTEVRAELLMAEIAEEQRNYAVARDCYRRAVHHPSADPLTRAAALTRLQDLPRR
ncbi:MAG TPA: tetratricopeptide repeat protein [Bryobacteraceae bacterium]|nr:tetratricopeptide repeat protein [Bryobacteraceae bacterium]